MDKRNTHASSLEHKRASYKIACIVSILVFDKIQLALVLIKYGGVLACDMALLLLLVEELGRML